MREKPMPEELLAATARLVTETVDRLQEVLSYSQTTSDFEWPRMLLYRLTDAQDTIGMLVGLHAAHVYRAGYSRESIGRYTQTYQQVARTEIPQKQDFDYLDGLTGQPAKEERSSRYIAGKIARDHFGDSDFHEEWTIACIHALQALQCDEPEVLDQLPASISIKAQRVYATMTPERLETAPA
ncbi:hypothetical protein ACQEU6_32070 [Spirillospora sp. CA-108201]